MQVFRTITKKDNLALGLGYFDGIHLGHQKLITTLVKEAQKRGVKSAVITFQKNPADYFNPAPTPDIQDLSAKEQILASLGVDYLFELDFEQYKNLSSYQYLNDILIKNFSPTLIITGYNHTFGKDRKGTPNFLQELSNELNYTYIKIPEQKYNNQQISSTAIRNHIKKANLELANSLLGRDFSIKGKVIKGQNLATSLNYPTANINWDKSIVKLPLGVYFGRVKIDNRILPALISWSSKPTISNDNQEVLEAHIYNFSEDIYDRTIEVSFVKKIRDQKKFNNLDELKNQIQKDYLQFTQWV